MSYTDLNTGSTIWDAHSTIDSALTKLNDLGRIDDAQAIINQVAETTDYSHIDADQTRTPDAKLDMYASAYRKTMNTVARKLNQAASIAQAQHNDDSSAAFGLRGLAGDAANLATSSRDASARARQITDPAARQAELADALSNGDKIYARALAKTAIAERDHVTANQFIAANPHLESAVERLWDARHKRGDQRAFGQAQYLAKGGSLQPTALNNMPAYQIAARAERKTTS